jgi:hypothetical protein
LGATVQNVGVDHRRLDVDVPEQLLNRANVIALLQQVGCERVPKRVSRGVLSDAGRSHPECREARADLAAIVVGLAGATCQAGSPASSVDLNRTPGGRLRIGDIEVV